MLAADAVKPARKTLLRIRGWRNCVRQRLQNRRLNYPLVTSLYRKYPKAEVRRRAGARPSPGSLSPAPSQAPNLPLKRSRIAARAARLARLGNDGPSWRGSPLVSACRETSSMLSYIRGRVHGWPRCGRPSAAVCDCRRSAPRSPRSHRPPLPLRPPILRRCVPSPSRSGQARQDRSGRCPRYRAFRGHRREAAAVAG